MSNYLDENHYTCLSSCYECGKRIEIDFYDNHFQTRENVTFLGRLGKEKYTYCPYCGARNTGFIPYDPEQRINVFADDVVIDVDEEELNDEDAWWPEAEGVTLIDEEEEEEDSWEVEDESVKELFVCSSCGEKFRLNPKGCDKIYCYYCGKETIR